MDVEKLPNINKVKLAIERLQSKSFPEYVEGQNVDNYVNIVADMIFEEFDTIISFSQPLKCDSKFFNFFRVRNFDQIKNINLIREHSYPPINIVGSGRCNFPRFPVFYCSSDPGSALFEIERTCPDANHKYCISKWEIIPSDETFFYESYLNIEFPLENELKIFQEKFPDLIHQTLENSVKGPVANEVRDGMVEYIKYFHNLFIQDSKKSISAALAHRSLYAPHNHRIDMLLYPSVQTKYKGINFALSPNFVENNLRLKRLYVVTLEQYDVDRGVYHLEFRDYADVEKNVVMWKNFSESEDEFRNVIKDDFSEMIGNNNNAFAK